MVLGATVLPGGHGRRHGPAGTCLPLSKCRISCAADSILGTRTSPAQRPLFSGEETDARVEVAPGQAGSPERGLLQSKAKNPPEEHR